MSPRGIIAIADPPTNAHVIPHAAKFLLMAKGRFEAAQICEASGGDPRVAEWLRKAVTPIGTTGDPDFGGPVGDPFSSAFFASLKNESVFIRMLTDNSLRKVPLGQKMGAIVSGVVAHVVGEGLPAPVGRWLATGLKLAPQKTIALCVVSAEVAKGTTKEAQGIVTAELKSSVALATDLAFLNVLAAGATVIASSGSGADDMTKDLRALLNAVDARGGGRGLYFICGSQAAKSAAVMDVTRRMSPAGGTLLGLPALVSDALPPDEIFCVNAYGVAANAGAIELEVSEQASLEMQDPATNPPNAATIMVSLWQQNLAALRALVFWGAQVFSPHTVSILTGVAWGG